MSADFLKGKYAKSFSYSSEDHSHKWPDTELDMESITISSEDEVLSEYDPEECLKSKFNNEVWKNDAIWNGLMLLPDGETINELLTNNGDIKKLFKLNGKTLLLIASWLGKTEIVKVLLENGVDPSAEDEAGRTPIHLAAYAGKTECLKQLLDYGGEINKWETSKEMTPLHCAAVSGHLACLKLLLKHGADVNAGIVCEKTPLYFAVQNGSVPCVKELLEYHASPNTPQIFSETPLHLAANLGNHDIIQLLLEYGAAVNVQCGPEKVTPLHLAAEDGDVECVNALIEAGANVSIRNRKQQTPLHLAALSQSPETIELLLRKNSNPNDTDSDGRTPLHSCIVKATRSCDCIRLLLDAGAEVNKPDEFGYTPLHLAALNEFSHCVMLLINYGGDVTMRTNGGISVLTFITRKTPDVIPKYIAKFDASIKLSDHELGDVDCELKLDFRVLVPTVGNKETELLLNFIEVGHKQILKHPLSETFLFLKWARIRKFFLFSMMYHQIFVTLFTLYVIEVFLKNCPYSKSLGQVCWVPNYVRNIGYIIIFFNLVFLAKELFQIAHCWKNYIKIWENWLQWMIIISVFCCVQPKPNMNVREDVYDWQHHVAALSIFLTWLELMMIVGRFPVFGLYIQMFTRVFINFVKFMVAYFGLFIAFALSFGVIFANYPAFFDLKWVLLKVIIMMSGELEYEDVFFPEKPEYAIRYPYTAHLMYFCFVLLVTLILNNLLVGLAVSDIQGLQQSAGLDRLVRQAELVAHLESMLFSRLLKWVPNKMMKFFHNQALLLKSHYHWALYIRPNDPREERIPKELIQNIYQLVVERKEKPQNRRSKKTKVESCNAMSPPMSRMGSLNSDKNNTIIKAQLDELFKEFQENTRIFKEKLDRIAGHITKSTR